MYKALARVITSQGVLQVGKTYKPTPELDRFFDDGYLEKPKSKKTTKKTKTHEE